MGSLIRFYYTWKKARRGTSEVESHMKCKPHTTDGADTGKEDEDEDREEWIVSSYLCCPSGVNCVTLDCVPYFSEYKSSFLSQLSTSKSGTRLIVAKLNLDIVFSARLCCRSSYHRLRNKSL